MTEVDVGGGMLRVGPDEVVLGDQRLRTSAITAVRYGALIHTTNSFPDHKSYALWLTDGKHTIHVECARGLFVGSATIRTRFDQAVQAIWEPVVVPICQSMIRSFRDAGGFTVAGADTPWWSLTSSVNVRHDPTLVFDHDGVHQTKPSRKDLKWQHYGGHAVANGEFLITDSTFRPSWRDKLNSRYWWATLSLRQTWNAVCLDPVLTQLRESKLLSG